MPQKKITDLQLRDNVSDELSIPSDDGIQSYRVTAAQIKAYILQAGVIVRSLIQAEERMPISAVLPFAGTVAPSGFLFCDGSAISRSTYANLFAEIGTTHGQGDGSTTFNLPDYRGRFLRGVNGGSSNDPDTSTRTSMATGGNTGNNVGSVQGHAYQTHTHTQNSHSHDNGVYTYTSVSMQKYGHVGSSASRLASNNTSVTHQSGATDAITATNQNASPSGGTSQASANETRPVNAYVNYVIKY